MTDKTAKPEWLEELQSRIFEGLSSPAEKEAWTQDLDSAIPPGFPEKALTRIRDRFLHDLLVQVVMPLVPEGKKHTAIRDPISGVVDLLNRSIKGESVSKDEWRQAATAARCAYMFSAAAWSCSAEDAADAGYAAWHADAVASYAARSAARAAADAARAADAVASYAAWSAARASDAAAARAAADAAWSAADAAAAAFWQWAAEHLLALIREEVAAWEAAGRPA